MLDTAEQGGALNALILAAGLFILFGLLQAVATFGATYVGEDVSWTATNALRALVNWAEDDGPWPRINSDHPAYFYTLRAADTPDADLVNMLLAELTPKDVRQLFICHKEVFYRAYAGWSETKKSYVADFLDREYQVDKAGARAALFGHDAPLEEVPPAPRDDIIARVGPWGAVRR